MVAEETASGLCNSKAQTNILCCKTLPIYLAVAFWPDPTRFLRSFSKNRFHPESVTGQGKETDPSPLNRFPHFQKRAACVWAAAGAKRVWEWHAAPILCPESAVRLKQRLEKPASVRPWPQLYRAVCSVPSFVIEVSGSDADNNGQATFSGN